MKTLKTLLTVGFFVACSSAFAQTTVTADDVNVQITGQTTRENLWQIRNELAAVGLDFQYSPEFDGERRLIALQYKVIETATGIVVGEAGTTGSLQQPNNRTGFHLVRANGKFTAECFGNCNN